MTGSGGIDVSHLLSLPARLALALLARAVVRVRPLYYVKDWLDSDERGRNLHPYGETLAQANSASLGLTIETVDLPDPDAAAFRAGVHAGDACRRLSSAAICLGRYANHRSTDQIGTHEQTLFVDALTNTIDLCSSALECHVDRASVSKNSQKAFVEAFELDLEIARQMNTASFPALGPAISTDECGWFGMIWHEDACPFAYLKSVEFFAADPQAEETEYNFPREDELFDIPNQSLLGYITRIFMRLLHHFKPSQISIPQTLEAVQAASQPIIDHCSRFCLGQWGESDNPLRTSTESLEQITSTISLDEASFAEYEWCDCLTSIAKCLVEIDHQIGAFGYSDELACNGRHFIISETQHTSWLVGIKIESFCEPAAQLIAEFAATCRRDLATLRSLHRSYQPRDFHDYLIGPDADISEEGPLGPLWPVDRLIVSWSED